MPTIDGQLLNIFEIRQKKHNAGETRKKKHAFCFKVQDKKVIDEVSRHFSMFCCGIAAQKVHGFLFTRLQRC